MKKLNDNLWIDGFIKAFYFISGVILLNALEHGFRHSIQENAILIKMFPYVSLCIIVLSGPAWKKGLKIILMTMLATGIVGIILFFVPFDIPIMAQYHTIIINKSDDQHLLICFFISGNIIIGASIGYPLAGVPLTLKEYKALNGKQTSQ